MTKLALKFKIKNIAIILLIAIFFIADRWLKALALTRSGLAAIPLFGSWFSFEFTPNHYLAFSLPFSGWLVDGLILAIIAALIYYIFYLILKKKEHKTLIVLLTIILFGAISNILDRLAYGYVIDYFYLKNLTVFNLADAMISASVVYLLIFLTQPTPMLETAENLGFVFNTLKNLKLNGQGKRLVPSNKNAIELLTLHDLQELIAPAKKEGSFDNELLQKILTEEYRAKMMAGKSSVFYNYRKVLSQPWFVDHLRAMLNETFSKN